MSIKVTFLGSDSSTLSKGGQIRLVIRGISTNDLPIFTHFDGIKQLQRNLSMEFGTAFTNFFEEITGEVLDMVGGAILEIFFEESLNKQGFIESESYKKFLATYSGKVFLQPNPEKQNLQPQSDKMKPSQLIQVSSPILVNIEDDDDDIVQELSLNEFKKSTSTQLQAKKAAIGNDPQKEVTSDSNHLLALNLAQQKGEQQDQRQKTSFHENSQQKQDLAPVLVNDYSQAQPSWLDIFSISPHQQSESQSAINNNFYNNSVSNNSYFFKNEKNKNFTNENENQLVIKLENEKDNIKQKFEPSRKLIYQSQFLRKKLNVKMRELFIVRNLLKNQVIFNSFFCGKCSKGMKMGIKCHACDSHATYCESCNTKCPQCGILMKKTNSFWNLCRLEAMLRSLLVACNSCGEHVKAIDFTSHIDKCENVQVSCKYCKESLHINNLKKHKKEQCRRRPMKCNDCSATYPFCKRKKHNCFKQIHKFKVETSQILNETRQFTDDKFQALEKFMQEFKQITGIGQF